MEGIRLHPDLTENICEFVYRRVWEYCEGIMFAEDTVQLAPNKTDPDEGNQAQDDSSILFLSIVQFWLLVPGLVHWPCTTTAQFPLFQPSETKLS